MSILKELKCLLGTKPEFSVQNMPEDSVWRVEIVIKNKRIIAFKPTAVEAVETAATKAVEILRPNDWFEDQVWN